MPPNSTVFSKISKRAFVILLNGLNSMAAPLSNMVISYLVISFISIDFWGNVVYIIILLDFAFNIIAWGNKPFLTQEFGLSPKSINSLWRISFSGRLPFLLLFVSVIFLLNYSLQIKLCLVAWAIARYIYQSFDAIIVFNRDFIFSLLVELSGLCIIVVPVVIVQQRLSIPALISFYAISLTVKSVAALVYYRKIFVKDLSLKISWGNWFKDSINYFSISFPFLLLTFSGMLQSKIDLYGVAYFLGKEDIAQYQIYLALLGVSQLVASILLSPFARNIFRLNKESFKKLERLFITSGFFISFILIVFFYVLTTYVYRFHLSFYMYVLGYLYIFVFYLYLLKGYELGKQRKQKVFAIFSFAGSFINFLFSILLTPLLGIEGALLSGVLSQFFMVLLFRYSNV